MNALPTDSQLPGLDKNFWDMWNSVYYLQPAHDDYGLFKKWKLFKKADNTQVGSEMDFVQIANLLFEKRDEWNKELEKIILGES